MAQSSDGGAVGAVGAASTLTTTPEPASMTLLATGLVGMFGFVRRRKAA